jgi:hypothetical protein
LKQEIKTGNKNRKQKQIIETGNQNRKQKQIIETGNQNRKQKQETKTELFLNILNREIIREINNLNYHWCFSNAFSSEKLIIPERDSSGILERKLKKY